MDDKAEVSKMEKSLESYLKILCQRARELGVSEAVAIPVTDIVVDERARLKCLAPRCLFYGTCLVCPPNVMPISEFKNILKSYHGAILVKLEAAISAPPEELTAQNDLSEVLETLKSAISGGDQPSTPITEYIRAIRDSQKKLYGIMSQIESLCFAEGYRFAAGLGAGGCPFCDECVGPQSGLPCRYPFKARPSMDALGIDVVATAERVGMQIDFTLNKTGSWVGLILID